MGLRRSLVRMLDAKARPGPRSTGRDPFELIAYMLRDVPSPLVFDVGCNQGQSASKILGLLPRATIHAFEPSPQTADQCCAAFMRDRRVTVHTMALGAEAGTLTLHTHAGGATDSLLADGRAFKQFTPREWAAPREAVEVEVRTVEDVCATLGAARIDLLKTDTQGFDDRVLQGCGGMLSGGQIGIVMAELIYAALYEGQAQPHAIMGLLSDAGFRLVGLFDASYESGPAIAWCDGLFVHTSLLAGK